MSLGLGSLGQHPGVSSNIIAGDNAAPFSLLGLLTGSLYGYLRLSQIFHGCGQSQLMNQLSAAFGQLPRRCYYDHLEN